MQRPGGPHFFTLAEVEVKTSDNEYTSVGKTDDVKQSSTWGDHVSGYGASIAVDGHKSTFTQTKDEMCESITLYLHFNISNVIVFMIDAFKCLKRSLVGIGL